MKVLWWLRVKNTVTLQLISDASPLLSYVIVGGPDLCAVVVMASTTSMMRCRAESVPMVMSVPQKSLSMEPTMPTMFRWEDFFASCSVIPPAEEEISDIRGSTHRNSQPEISTPSTVLIYCGHMITGSHEVSQQPAPLSPELVGSGQTAVSSDHTQVGDAQLHQVAGGLHATLPGAEVLAASAADDRPSLKQSEAGAIGSESHVCLFLFFLCLCFCHSPAEASWTHSPIWPGGCVPLHPPGPGSPAAHVNLRCQL